MHAFFNLISLRISFIAFTFSCMLLLSCSSTKETANTQAPLPPPPPNAQVLEWQEKQKEMEDTRESSGLNQAVMAQIDEYAEQKTVLTCQMRGLSEQEQQSMSELEAGELKAQMNAIDEQLSPLNAEIASYCDTQRKRDYFDQIFKHKLKRCP